jgi:hypothetical protein
MSKYYQLNANSLKGEILVTIRNRHIKLLATQILENEIIPIQYLDDKIKLNFTPHQDNDTITDEIRLKFIYNILRSESNKYTSVLINKMCE